MTEHRSSDERRDQIVDAMIEALARHGYAKATISKIADRAGLTSGLLHYHFPNKLAILRGALDRLGAEQLEVLESVAAEYPAKPAEALDALLVKLLAPGEDARPERVAAWVAILAEAIREPEVADQLAAILGDYRSLFAEVIELGRDAGTFELGDESPQAVAAGLVALVQGYYTVAATARETIPRGSAIEVARRFVSGYEVGGR